MPTLRVLPHPQVCPKGTRLEVRPGESLLGAMLSARIPVDHACEMSCACASCHVLVRSGFESLEPPREQEADMLDKAAGAEPLSRLACQARMPHGDVTIEIPPHASPYAGGRR